MDEWRAEGRELFIGEGRHVQISTEGAAALLAAAHNGSVAQEREACAKVAEMTPATYKDHEDRHLTYGWCEAQSAISKAIRARGKS